MKDIRGDISQFSQRRLLLLSPSITTAKQPKLEQSSNNKMPFTSSRRSSMKSNKQQSKMQVYN
jgi:hypothetical protein